MTPFSSKLAGICRRIAAASLPPLDAELLRLAEQFETLSLDGTGSVSTIDEKLALFERVIAGERSP